MTHSFDGLADEISTLLKNRGDTGDRGDSREKMSRISSVGVTPGRAPLSPLEVEGCQPVQSRGDGKDASNQLLSGGVTPVTPVTCDFAEPRVGSHDHRFDRKSHAPDAGQIIRFPAPPAGNSQEWVIGLRRLDAMPPPAAFTDERWAQLIADAHGFIDRWGRAATQFGWSTLDLFGVHPLAPITRYDAKGLIPLLGGNSVVAVSEHTATIRMPSGSTLRFNRRSKTAGVCIWEIH